MSDTHVAILAAGKGTRMKSAQPKVLHPAAGLPLIEHVLRTAERLNPASVTVIVGHLADAVKVGLAKRMGLTFALQEPQLGTGHALLQVEPHLRGASGTLVLLSGDVPLLRPDTLRALVDRHQKSRAAATVLTARVPQPRGYGRIVRDDNAAIAAIVEEKDATDDQRRIDEINSGIYAFDLAPLFDALKNVRSSNAQNEYYLPDLVRIYRARGDRVETLILDDAREVLGVNSRKELAEVTAIMNRNRIDELMASGVTIIDPATTWIGPDVVIGSETVLHPGVYLEGRTRIGQSCVINSGVRIVDSTLDDEAVVNNFCVICESHIARGARVGPFAHIRPQSEVGEDARIGNFVELKKTTIGKGSKASHLSYLGDASIGEHVNIGAGTITCNYDGSAKHPTVIEDGAFIGSDSQLVAPVRVGKDAYVAAGSSIVEDVPAGALGIARGRQINKPGWVAEKKRKR
ncbi:MAG TPA: bifunctional UDP-N-acetylglucosamine diphosphorylase/glucosamine-1-phosphate N-acetyltransferase GlmU [Vicinamibacterales bacterium]|jgi:bifunctional UDP-N-acetylglucosamine pyrophosphorylase/glucosamine-1-phosphate N-acetyltransferase|nr:bifunctional UDP-N-acetylglucosamine diphosphorylase/glucosamine-1-phosphate N-acetyltransferase GlmU [Vicinamibacterales bacterium]